MVVIITMPALALWWVLEIVIRRIVTGRRSRGNVRVGVVRGIGVGVDGGLRGYCPAIGSAVMVMLKPPPPHPWPALPRFKEAGLLSAVTLESTLETTLVGIHSHDAANIIPWDICCASLRVETRLR